MAFRCVWEQGDDDGDGLCGGNAAGSAAAVSRKLVVDKEDGLNRNDAPSSLYDVCSLWRRALLHPTVQHETACAVYHVNTVTGAHGCQQLNETQASRQLRD